MTNGPVLQPVPQPDERLKQLMEYTKFHIGMYTTLCTLLIGILGLKMFETAVDRTRCVLFAVLICFVLAGMFGGLVGSSIPFHTSFQRFRTTPTTPAWLDWVASKWNARVPARFNFNFGWLTGELCTTLEHLFFWVGIVFALVAVGIVTANPGKSIEIYQ
jgi:hypothetical protein